VEQLRRKAIDNSDIVNNNSTTIKVIQITHARTFEQCAERGKWQIKGEFSSFLAGCLPFLFQPAFVSCVVALYPR
jgi:hypothetical protein